MERIQRDWKHNICVEYRDSLWRPFCHALKKYQMIQPGDRIAVCISGGKDSMLMAKLMQIYQKQTGGFENEFLVMDPGYRTENLNQIQQNADYLGIPIQIFPQNIFEIAYQSEKSPCYLCARMRRGALYHEAQKNGCNKIALGHHFNDVIETTLMGMSYSSQLSGMLPKLKSTNFEGMELIRPLYEIHEEEIVRWRDNNNLTFLQCACKISESYGTERELGKRKEIKEYIRENGEKYPGFEDSLFQALHHVVIESFPGTDHRDKTIGG